MIKLLLVNNINFVLTQIILSLLNITVHCYNSEKNDLPQKNEQNTKFFKTRVNATFICA